LGGDGSGENGSGGDGSGKNGSVGNGSVRNGSVAKKVAADLLPFNWFLPNSSSKKYDFFSDFVNFPNNAHLLLPILQMVMTFFSKSLFLSTVGHRHPHYDFLWQFKTFPFLFNVSFFTNPSYSALARH
jgi:hypothetical protein